MSCTYGTVHGAALRKASSEVFARTRQEPSRKGQRSKPPAAICFACVSSCRESTLFFSLLTKICISCKIHSTKICISCNGNVTKPGKTLNCCPLLCRTPQLSCWCRRTLVRAFRLPVLGVARNPDAFTGKRVSCVSPTRCPRALSAHPTLRPNGLMWGY